MSEYRHTSEELTALDLMMWREARQRAWKDPRNIEMARLMFGDFRRSEDLTVRVDWGGVESITICEGACVIRKSPAMGMSEGTLEYSPYTVVSLPKVETEEDKKAEAMRMWQEIAMYRAWGMPALQPRPTGLDVSTT